MWSGLVDKNSQKYTNEEIERLKAASELLHAENEKLRLEIDSFTKGRQLLLERLQEQEKVKQNVQKELLKCQTNLKFEIKAREGLAKRMNIHEYEATKYKEECFNQREELSTLRYRVKDLEYRLNQERSKRLRDLHETDLLRKRNNELESLGAHAEKQALEATQSLHDKLEKLEVVMQQNESQKRIITSMTGEILILNSEMASLKEDLKRALEGKYRHENTISTKTREMEGLEREVSKLRREVAVGLKGTWSMTSLNELFDSEEGEVPHHHGGRQTTLHTSSSSSTLPAVSLRKSEVVSMSATPFSSSYLSSSSSAHRREVSHHSPNSTLPTHSFHPSELQGKRYNRNPFSATHSSPPSSPEQRHRLTSSDLLTQHGPDASEVLSTGPKSRYTGSGLGLRKSEVPEFNPKGSAKSVLKRILKEHQAREAR
jgi:hypothetical protein